MSKKNIKSVKRFSRQTKLMFSSLIFEKIKRALTKKHICLHPQDHLDIKKFYLGKRGNSVFAQNLLIFYHQNIEEMLTLHVSRKVMMNINLKT